MFTEELCIEIFKDMHQNQIGHLYVFLGEVPV